jgi:ABC-type Mn2+/Zn2+ transport system ATPase subunit
MTTDMQQSAITINSTPCKSSDTCDQPRAHRLRLQGLSVDYSALRALDDVSFETHCGRSLALVGPNGAGKSTLMKSLAGLVPASAGSIHWRGEALVRSNPEIAYLAQRSEVDWNFPLTVRGLVEMGRYPHTGIWRRYSVHDADVVEGAIEAMHLGDLAGRQISALSGGQQQRAFIARALAQEAHVLLLDEPFSGLDRPARENLTEILALLSADGRLLIAAHHDLDTVTEIFDDVLLLNRSTVAFGAVDQVFTTDNVNACFGKRHRPADTGLHRSTTGRAADSVPLSS